MKIYLLDRNKAMTDAWKKWFSEDDIEIVTDDFKNFMDNHPDIDAVVSPANSFGLMDGGYDKAIIDYFGEELMMCVQEYIKRHWCGEQPVGTSMIVPIYNRIVKNKIRESHGFVSKKYAILIHTPTMRTPEIIKDPRIIYQCMRTTLIKTKNQEVTDIVIPAFGGATGRVDYDVIAKMMKYAYDSIMNPPTEIDWGYAWHIANKLII